MFFMMDPQVISSMPFAIPYISTQIGMGARQWNEMYMYMYICIYISCIYTVFLYIYTYYSQIMIT